MMFFSGGEQMRVIGRGILWSMGMLAILSSGLVAQDATKKKVEPKKFVSQSSGFSVMFPPGKVEEETQMIGADKKVPQHMFIVEVNPKEVYIVSEQGGTKSSAKDTFDAGMKGLVGKGKLVSKEDFEFGPKKFPGRTMIVDQSENGGPVMKVNFILSGEKFYHVMAVGTSEHVNSTKVKAYLDSFELVVAKPAAKEEKAGKKFVNTEGGYSVAFPGKPTIQKQDLPGGKITIVMNIYKSDEGTFVVSHNPVPGVEAGTDGEKILDSSEKGVVGKSKLISSKKVDIGVKKATAREIVFENKRNDTEVRFRALLVWHNDMLIQVLVGGADNFGDSKAAKDFIKSFELLPKKADD
jgi:hypothetical protein